MSPLVDQLTIIENPMQTEGGYGVRTYWRILVNGEEITYRAKPFDASASSAIVHECVNCYGCGSPDLAIRRSADAIVWFGNHPDLASDSSWPANDIFVFDIDEYLSLIHI